MKNKSFWILAVMVLTGLGWVAGPVQAAEEGRPPAFSDIDKDKDGYLSVDEIVSVPGLAEQLLELDKNVDGKLSKEEYAAVTSVAPGTSGETPRMMVD